MKIVLIPGSEKLRKAMEPEQPKLSALEALTRMSYERPKTLTVTELEKAKYTSKKRGKNGKWEYTYQNGTGPHGRGAGPGEGKADGTGKPKAMNKVSSRDHTKLSNSVAEVMTKVNGTRANIPLQELFGAVKSQGFVPLDEDGTEWQGALVVKKGRVSIPLGHSSSKTHREGYDDAEYKELEGAHLQIQWEKMEHNGRYDVTAYVL